MTMGVNSATLNNVGFPGGSTYNWDVSADPIIRFNPHGRLDFYLIGGPGVYHRHGWAADTRNSLPKLDTTKCLPAIAPAIFR